MIFYIIFKYLKTSIIDISIYNNIKNEFLIIKKYEY